MRGKYWKSICAIPAYMFLLSPSGKRVQKMEGGNWIDQHEAQKVVDAAEDELSDLRAELAGLKTGYEAYERVNAELRAECEKLRAYGEEFASLAERRREELDALRVSLRAFTGACYPVSKSIDERGYVWSESYLDQALEMSKEQSHD
ncbi:hypothetical protein V2I60_19820 [Pseudomonas viridiflava]|uniref:hypothetical protein n=1 Tax=Pseudomonas viridiflava TaxID=33069 RepID=UPI002EA57701|nr:hypothetical protein [Pseudomonas viridiflava]